MGFAVLGYLVLGVILVAGIYYIATNIQFKNKEKK